MKSSSVSFVEDYGLKMCDLSSVQLKMNWCHICLTQQELNPVLSDTKKEARNYNTD